MIKEIKLLFSVKIIKPMSAEPNSNTVVGLGTSATLVNIAKVLLLLSKMLCSRAKFELKLIYHYRYHCN